MSANWHGGNEFLINVNEVYHKKKKKVLEYEMSINDIEVFFSVTTVQQEVSLERSHGICSLNG